MPHSLLSPIKRIIYISGTLDFSQLTTSKSNQFWDNFKTIAYQYFPKSTVIANADYLYFPLQVKRIKKISNAIIEKYDDGTPTILLGHSWGGIIAISIASKFTKTPVLAIITLNSPIQLSKAVPTKIPTLHIRGTSDWLIPKFLHHPKAIPLPMGHVISKIISHRPWHLMLQAMTTFLSQYYKK